MGIGIGPKAYKLVADVREFTEGMTVSRRELSLSRRIMEETRPVVEKFGDSWDVLNQQLNKNLITVQDHARAFIALKAELPENVASQELLTEQLRQADAVRQSLLTTEQREHQQLEQLNVAIAANNSLAAQGIITDKAKLDNFLKLNSVLPENVAIQKEEAAAEQDSIGIRRQLITVEQEFAEKRARSFELLKAGKIDRDEYLRYLDLHKQKLPANIAAEEKLAEAQQRKDAVIQRGLALNAQYLPAATQSRNKLAEVTAAHRAGHVGIESYNNAWLQLTATQLTGIPVVGRYASMLASVGPIGVAVAVAAAGVATAVRNVHDQMQKIDDLLNTAENVGIAADQFQRMSAAAHLADIDAREFSSGIETMMINISKAAMDPGGKIGKVFKLAELDAKALKAMRPEEAFQKATEAIHEMGNADDRIRSAKGIFGNADFMRINSGHIELANDNIRAMGGAIDDVKSEKFREMDKSIDSMNQNIDLFWKQLTFDVSPGLEMAAKSATKLMHIFNPIGVATLGIAAPVLRDPVTGASKPMADVTKARTESEEEEKKSAKDIAKEVAKADEMRWEEQARDRQNFSDFTKQLEKDEADTSRTLWDEANREADKEQEEDFKRRVELEKEADKAVSDAAKDAADVRKELDKEVRQFKMTDREKKLDDYRAQGVNEAELEKIDLLLKEKELRETILKTQNASSLVIKADSREAADMMVHAQRAAQLRLQAMEKSASRSGVSIPVLRPARLSLLESLSLPPSSGPLAMTSPPQSFLPGSDDRQEKLQEKANDYLAALVRKPDVTFEIEEVTL